MKQIKEAIDRLEFWKLPERFQSNPELEGEQAYYMTKQELLALLKLAQGKAYYDGYMLGLNNNHPRKSKIEYDFEHYWANFLKEIQP